MNGDAAAARSHWPTWLTADCFLLKASLPDVRFPPPLSPVLIAIAVPSSAQSFTFSDTHPVKKSLNQKEARLWCIAPLLRNRFPSCHAVRNNFAVPHAFAFCLAISLTFLLHDSAGQKQQVIVPLLSA